MYTVSECKPHIATGDLFKDGGKRLAPGTVVPQIAVHLDGVALDNWTRDADSGARPMLEAFAHFKNLGADFSHFPFAHFWQIEELFVTGQIPAGADLYWSAEKEDCGAAYSIVYVEGKGWLTQF